MRLLVAAVSEYAIFMLDPEGLVTTWNLGAQRLKGYTADEIRGKHFSVFYTERDRQRGHPQNELKLAAEHGSYKEEGWRVRKDGSQFYASVTITALRNDRGEISGFSKVTADLTDRLAAEESARRLVEARTTQALSEALQRSTSAFSSALRREDIAKAVYDTVFPPLGADAGSLIVRDPESDVLRLAWGHGFTEDTKRRYRTFSMLEDTPHTRAAREQRPLFLTTREEVVRAYPNASAPYSAVMALPLTNRGVSTGLLTLSWSKPRDFSAADKTLALAFADQCALALDRALLFEKELLAKERASFLAEADTVLFRSLDSDQILKELVNLAVPRLGDWCAIEMVEGESTRQVAVAHRDPEKIRYAAKLREQFPPDRNRKSGLFEVMRTGKPELHPEVPDALLVKLARSPEELEAARALSIRSGITVPLVARGQPLGAMTLIWSETDHAYSQDDVDFVMELCHRAALAVENARLYEEVHKAVRVRDDFLSIAGHEVRTPLAALQLHLHTLAKTTRSDDGIQDPRAIEKLTKARTTVDRMRGTADRLEKLVEELLDVSRITSGKLQLEVEELDLGSMTREVVGRFEEQFQRRNVHLSVQTDGNLTGRLDRFRIEQVVTNLITNALKYGDGKPVQVEVSGGEATLTLRVKDSGIGINLESQQRIFERFERAVSDRNYGGLGLGLWITRQIVEASGGTISVESELGKGSVFTVQLPRESPLPRPARNEAAAAAP